MVIVVFGVSGVVVFVKLFGLIYVFGLKVDGCYKNVLINGIGKVGGVFVIQDMLWLFLLQVDVKVGDMWFVIVGMLIDLMYFVVFDLWLWLQGMLMLYFYQFIGIMLFDMLLYVIEGCLIGNFKLYVSIFCYENFNGCVGGSDFGGMFIWVQCELCLKLLGEFVLNLLQFFDFVLVIGVDMVVSKVKCGDMMCQLFDCVLLVVMFCIECWSVIDVDVKFIGCKLIKSLQLLIINLYMYILLQDGVLLFELLQFGVVGGMFVINVYFDGSCMLFKGCFMLVVWYLKFKQLFLMQKVMQMVFGEINGDVLLLVMGNLLVVFVVMLIGEVKVFIINGCISCLLMEVVGLNVVNVVYEKLFGNCDVNINCVVIDFVVIDGMFDLKVFVFDIDDVFINVDGLINLCDELFDLKIYLYMKGFWIFLLCLLLYVKGMFKNLKVGVDVGVFVLCVGVMVGFGLINLFVVLILLIVLSNNCDVLCFELFGQMKVKVVQ